MIHSSVYELLDQFFKTASDGNLEGYVECFTKDAMFIGTDPTEYWSTIEFFQLCQKAFGEKGGWTYTPLGREVIPCGSLYAWFHERLQNEKYGQARGTGLATYGPDGWKISRYVLSFEIPNETIHALLTLKKK